jgi:hypothetical protein
MMSEILYITVQDSLIFHHITPGPSLSRPAKDASPKARKIDKVLAGFVTCTPFAGQDIETTELARRLMALV